MESRVDRLAAHLNPALGGGKRFRVAVLGAAGGIGQPLSLLLKQCPYIAQLNVYDIANTNGVAADLGHIDTSTRVRSYTGDKQLAAALVGCDLVVIPAGIPRKPGMTRDQLFNINAGIVKTLVQACARHCPKAWLNIISNPVNSTVPIAAGILQQEGVYDPNTLFGVTTLDVCRASTFLAERLGCHPEEVHVPVIGGHAGNSILPLFSQATPAVSLTDQEVDALTKRTQNGGTEVVEAKAGAGSATLSMAYAAARFAEACLRAKRGEAGVIQCSYVASNLTESPFLASRVLLGRHGIEHFLPLGPLSESERARLQVAIVELGASIEKGVKFARGD